MKVLYVLMFVCLSLQAWLSQSVTSTVSTSANESSTSNQMEFDPPTLHLERFSATDDFMWQVSF